MDLRHEIDINFCSLLALVMSPFQNVIGHLILPWKSDIPISISVHLLLAVFFKVKHDIQLFVIINFCSFSFP